MEWLSLKTHAKETYDCFISASVILASAVCRTTRLAGAVATCSTARSGYKFRDSSARSGTKSEEDRSQDREGVDMHRRGVGWVLVCWEVEERF